MTEYRGRKSTQNLNFGFPSRFFGGPILQVLTNGIGFPGSSLCLACFPLASAFPPSLHRGLGIGFPYRSRVV